MSATADDRWTCPACGSTVLSPYRRPDLSRAFLAIAQRRPCPAHRIAPPQESTSAHDRP